MSVTWLPGLSRCGSLTAHSEWGIILWLSSSTPCVFSLADSPEGRVGAFPPESQAVSSFILQSGKEEHRNGDYW